MLNYIWLGLILAAVVIGGYKGLMPEVTTAAFDSARMAVMTLALPLLGVMALWLGIMRLAEKSGFIFIMARAVRPLMRFLFPEVPANHPAMGAMILNISANMLGLGNAATPFGLKAMKHLDELSPTPGVATNSMCTFLVINTSSVVLLSSGAMGVMAAGGATIPTAFVGTALIATFCSTTVGLFAVKFMERLPMYRIPAVTAAAPATPPPLPSPEAEAARPGAAAVELPGVPQSDPEAEAETARPKSLPGWGLGVLAVFLLAFAGLFLVQLFPVLDIFPGAHGRSANEENTAGLFVRVIETIGILAIPFIISFFVLYAALCRVSVYEEFVEGAKEGFHIAVRIIPYLVAILVAIGMFRAADGIEVISFLLKPLLEFLRFPVELLPIALLRPLSGSGTLALLGDLVATHGPDSALARTGATIAGSTETTFYVLAVYFGSVGIRRTRHAVPAGLIADVTGITAAVIVASLVFG